LVEAAPAIEAWAASDRRAFGEAFHRIEAFAEVDGRMKVLDMKNDASREDILVVRERPVEIYRSSIATDYDPEGGL
jgi:type III restriction enzyme